MQSAFFLFMFLPLQIYSGFGLSCAKFIRPTRIASGRTFFRRTVQLMISSSHASDDSDDGDSKNSRSIPGEHTADNLHKPSSPSVPTSSSISDDREQTDQVDSNPHRKLHTLTVCMVPPPTNDIVWQKLAEMRKELKDPGFYRWPPHANMLYPFLQFTDDELPDIVQRLHEAGKQHEPFSISLNRYGTFGGRNRGVLWLFPESNCEDKQAPVDANNEMLIKDDGTTPLTRLFKSLEAEFPMCNDHLRKGGFNPHMTLSHFQNVAETLEAQKRMESLFSLDELKFTMDRFYLLKRQGDNGQFERVADVGIGAESIVEVFDTPIPFPAMPLEEEEWVHEERMNLKARRNGKRGKRGGGGGGGVQRRAPTWNRSRVPDTPEIIAQKRAERKEKRERLEREEREKEEQASVEQSLTATEPGDA